MVRADSALLDLSLEELLNVKVSGAILGEKELALAPSAVTVFQRGELARLAVDELAELMNLVPGFQSYRSSNNALRSVYSSRGRRMSNSEGEVLVLVDGMRMDIARSSGAIDAVAGLPLEMIERVEFVRGPGGAVYGSNAMMGVVNIVTRRDRSEVTAEAGAFGHQEVTVLGGDDIESFRVDAFFHWEKDEGDRYSLFVPSAGEEVSFEDPQETLRLHLKGSWKNTRLMFQHRRNRTRGFLTSGLAFGDQQSSSTNFSLLGVEQTATFGPIDATMLLSYSEDSLKDVGLLLGEGQLAQISVPPSNEPFRSKAEYHGHHEVRGKVVADWALDQSSDLQFGMEFRKLELDGVYINSNYDFAAFVSGQTPIPYYGGFEDTFLYQYPSRRDILGVFFQYQKRFEEKLHLTAGLRYDSFSSIGSELSPRLGCVYQLDKRNSLKLLYGSAFRAPSEEEMNLSENPFYVGNPDLKSEVAETADLIWVSRGKSRYLSLGVFVSSFEDAISLVSYPDGRNVHQNVELGSSKGFELEASQQIGERWLGRLTYTHLMDTPDAFFREADEKASFALCYNTNGWMANLTSVWTGGRQTAIRGGSLLNLDDYWAVHAKVEYRTSDGWSYFLRAKNVGDQQYLVPSLTVDFLGGIPSRGRELTVGISRRF
ncbi:TonB-dependent receptor [Pelagicoccus sp. SDUM812003]|uniref:TonB-dependent receptor plug domain-containing protein n=1 Tax=Pelagicoccus sp. SDUM812003 TaxID=3041267 RepID=UPI00280C782E|nr:TonB-dependent receptor [Pelagicoccus sp. SDUM812003]MDQ8203025.1 TonB-dependent receptor [Pelagicoccus sp. SDUM812003]